MAGDRVLTVRIAGDSKGAVGAIGQVTGASVGLGKKLLKIGGLFAGLSFGKELINDIKNVGMEYQKSMNLLQATTRATEKQMDIAGKTARDLGSDIDIPGTSASQAAGAMLELSKGGLTLRESMKAAKGTLLLAAAAQIDGARAAEIQAGAMAQFTLQAKDAGLVADTLANVSDAAAGGIEEVANALSYTGPVANSLKINIQDTASAIGLLHKNSIMASKAGTGLRGILVGLNPSTKKGAAALDALGISAFNSKGEFKGMEYVIGKLQKAQKRLTDEQFAALTVQAFGRNALSATNALANEGAEGWDKMAKAVSREGSAARVAKAKNKGFGGAVDTLHGQLEDLYITVWEKVEPALDKVTRTTAKVVGKFSDLINEGVDLTDALNNFDGEAFSKKVSSLVESALDGVSALAGKFSSKIASMFGKVDWVGLGIELGKVAIPMLAGLALGILNVDLGALLSGLAAHWQEVLLGILTIAFAPAKWVAKLAGLLRKIPFVGRLLGWIVTGINKVGSKFKDIFRKFFKGFGDGFKTALGWTGPGLIMRLVQFFSRMRSKIFEWAGLLAQKMGDAAMKMGQRFGNWLGRHGPAQAFSALVKIKNKIFGFLTNVGNWLIGHGRRLLGGLLNGLREKAGALWSWIRGVKDKALAPFSNAGSWLVNAGASIISGFINGIKSQFGNVKATLADLTSKLTSWKGPESLDRVILKDAGNLVIGGFAEGLESQYGMVRKSLTDFTNSMSSISPDMKGVSASTIGQAASALKSPTGKVPRGALAGGNVTNIQVDVNVRGNVIGERDFAKRITPDIRNELVKIGYRNVGRIFG